MDPKQSLSSRYDEAFVEPRRHNANLTSTSDIGMRFKYRNAYARARKRYHREASGTRDDAREVAILDGTRCAGAHMTIK